ncbi:MAG: glycoside hydrolase family 43 protein [Anditalea sp.]
MNLLENLKCLCFFILIFVGQNGLAQEQAAEKSIHLADPTIFFHEGIYYLYGTVEGNANQGFLVYSSPDLKEWEGPIGANQGFALRKGEAFGDKGFWAPQVFYHQDKFYMAYTANENIAIAESDSPLGPFTQSIKKPLEAPVKQIDPFVFIDEDGKTYLYHVRLAEGNRLFVAEMAEDLSAIRPETLKECINAADPWENTQEVPWPVAEGPSILKKDSLYYLVYSANDFRNPDYAVGYAISSHPMGPWKKQDSNPILGRTDIGINGPGHGDFISDKQGGLHYVFHTHYSNSEVAPRKTAIVKAGFSEDTDTGEHKLVMDMGSFYYPEI